MWSFFSSSVPTSFPEHIQTDMHAHFLPGIDDGAPDMETALRLIRGLYSLGYSRLVATPHIMAGYYPNTAAGIQSVFKQTQIAVQEADIPISLHVGAEYFIDDSFLALIEREELLSFGVKRCVLVEMSFVAPAPQWEEAIFALDYVDHDFYVYRDADTDQISVVYKRNVGGIGLIQPEQ